MVTQCNKKVEIGTRQSRSVSWLYLHAEIDSDVFSVQCSVIPNSTEEDQWSVENVEFCTSVVCVQRLACHAISASAEHVVCKLTRMNPVMK